MVNEDRWVRNQNCLFFVEFYLKHIIYFHVGAPGERGLEGPKGDIGPAGPRGNLQINIYIN